MAPSHAKPHTKPKILPLTSARFFAAFYVVLHHTFPAIHSQGAWQNWLRNFVGMGYISVSFFFMLSGFILAVVYLKDDKPVAKQRFFLARFARIYPLYFVAMFLDLPHYLHICHTIFHRSPLKTLNEFLATTFLIQAWLGFNALNTPGWSLSTETFFYIMFPFAGVLLWKVRHRFNLLVSLGIYILGLAIVQTINYIKGTDRQDIHPVPHLFVFLLGILLAKFFVWIGQHPRHSHQLEKWAPWMLAGCAVALLIIPVTGMETHVSLLQHGLLAPLFAIAILAFASGNQIIAKYFGSPWLVLLGEASYALYLIHFPIHYMLRRPLESIGMPIFLLYLAGVIGLSVASYYFLELPARQWILARVHVRSKETEVTSALSQ